MARTGYTEEIGSTLVELALAGNYRRTMADAVGISARTLRNWIAREDEPFCSFSEAFTKAEAHAHTTAVKGILKAGYEDGKWQALAWFLERRYKDEWSQHTTQEVTERKPLLITGPPREEKEDGAETSSETN